MLSVAIAELHFLHMGKSLSEKGQGQSTCTSNVIHPSSADLSGNRKSALRGPQVQAQAAHVVTAGHCGGRVCLQLPTENTVPRKDCWLKAQTGSWRAAPNDAKRASRNCRCQSRPSRLVRVAWHKSARGLCSHGPTPLSSLCRKWTPWFTWNCVEPSNGGSDAPWSRGWSAGWGLGSRKSESTPGVRARLCENKRLVLSGQKGPSVANWNHVASGAFWEMASHREWSIGFLSWDGRHWGAGVGKPWWVRLRYWAPASCPPPPL